MTNWSRLVEVEKVAAAGDRISRYKRYHSWDYPKFYSKNPGYEIKPYHRTLHHSRPKRILRRTRIVVENVVVTVPECLKPTREPQVINPGGNNREWNGIQPLCGPSHGSKEGRGRHVIANTGLKFHRAVIWYNHRCRLAKGMLLRRKKKKQVTASGIKLPAR